MGVWSEPIERVQRVGGPSGEFVIRSHPAGVSPTGASVSAVFDLVATLRRLIRRDRSWIVQVRTVESDPFGFPLLEHRCGSEEAALDEMRRLEAEIREGRHPVG